MATLGGKRSPRLTERYQISRITFAQLKPSSKPTFKSQQTLLKDKKSKPGRLNRRGSVNFMIGAKESSLPEASEKHTLQNSKSLRDLRRHSELFTVSVQSPVTNMPARYSPEVVLNLQKIDSEDLAEEGETDHQFIPMKSRNKVFLPPVSLSTPTMLSPGSPLSRNDEGYWSETANIMSVTNSKNRLKWRLRRWS